MTKEQLEALAQTLLEEKSDVGYVSSYGTGNAKAIHRLGNCIVIAALLLSPRPQNGSIK